MKPVCTSSISSKRREASVQGCTAMCIRSEGFIAANHNIQRFVLVPSRCCSPRYHLGCSGRDNPDNGVNSSFGERCYFYVGGGIHVGVADIYIGRVFLSRRWWSNSPRDCPMCPDMDGPTAVTFHTISYQRLEDASRVESFKPVEISIASSQACKVR